MAWEYSERTKQLFMDAIHGKPGTHMGEIDEPDGVGEHGSIACGDAMRFMFKVDRHPGDPLQDRITEARYLTFGCTSAIAASEALCMLIEEGNRSPLEALQITNQDIVTFLEGLPDQKIHCSVMGAEALAAAVFNWAQRRGVDLQALGIELATGEEEEGRIVCNCFSLTEPYIRRKIKELNLRTIPEITNAIKAGGACMACHHKPGGLQDLLDDIWDVDQVPEDTGPGSDVAGPARSPYQLGKQVEHAVAVSISPMLQKDGGGVELVDIKDQQVFMRLTGACAGCSGAVTTLKLLVERTLKEQVDERIQVIAV